MWILYPWKQEFCDCWTLFCWYELAKRRLGGHKNDDKWRILSDEVSADVFCAFFDWYIFSSMNGIDQRLFQLVFLHWFFYGSSSTMIWMQHRWKWSGSPWKRKLWLFLEKMTVKDNSFIAIHFLWCTFSMICLCSFFLLLCCLKTIVICLLPLSRISGREMHPWVDVHKSSKQELLNETREHTL